MKTRIKIVAMMALAVTGSLALPRAAAAAVLTSIGVIGFMRRKYA